MNLLAFLVAQAKQGGGLLSILVFIVPLGLLFYLMVVPQRKQRQKHQSFVSALGPGDDVVTSGGIYGTINHIEGDEVHLEVDTDVVLRVSRAAIARAAHEPETPPAAGGGGGLFKRPAPKAEETAETAD
jgi:preprotein translocase subunit YajC